MHFELDRALIDEILFFMENQDGDFLLDTQEMHVVDILNYEYTEKPDFGDKERFVALPGWGSQSGYRLMEKFTASLKNPVVRQELSSALNRNKGVFRAFRDVLEQYPETEKQWFNHKEKEMKREVIIWYNSLRVEWELEPVGFEPDDPSSIILEDFHIRQEDYCFYAEAENGETAATINASVNGKLLQVKSLEVKPEYRGMGIAKTLLSKLSAIADQQNLDVTIDVPSEADFFSRSLLLENFKPSMRRFVRKKE